MRPIDGDKISTELRSFDMEKSVLDMLFPVSYHFFIIR